MSEHEFELISGGKITHIKIFLNDITYRNYHVHNSLELLLVLNGSGYINLPDETIPLQPGSLIIINQNEAHEIDASGGHLVTVIIQVSRHFCETYLPAFSSTRFLQRDLTGCFADSPETLELLKSLICQTAQDYLQGENHFEFACLSQILRLFYLLFRNIPHEQLSDHDRSAIRKRMERMNRILEFMETNFVMPIRLTDLAKREELSPTYLSHFFSDNIGITFQEYLNNLRLERAMEILHNTALSMSEVALSSGFSDPKYLNKAMQQKMGCTVKAYRQTLSHSNAHTQQPQSSQLLERNLPIEEALDAIKRYVHSSAC